METTVELFRKLSEKSTQAEHDLKDMLDLLPPSLKAKTGMFTEAHMVKGMLQANAPEAQFPLEWSVCINHIADLIRPYRFCVTLCYFGGTIGFYASDWCHAYRCVVRFDSEQSGGANNSWTYLGEHLETIMRANASEFDDPRVELLCENLHGALTQIVENMRQYILQEVKNL